MKRLLNVACERFKRLIHYNTNPDSLFQTAKAVREQDQKQHIINDLAETRISQFTPVLISHPLTYPSIKDNVKEIKRIMRMIMFKYPGFIPMAPYLNYIECLDNNDPLERKIGITQTLALIHSRHIKEVWLYGDRISEGMEQEMDAAMQANVMVVNKTKRPAMKGPVEEGYRDFY